MKIRKDLLEKGFIVSTKTKYQFKTAIRYGHYNTKYKIHENSNYKNLYDLYSLYEDDTVLFFHRDRHQLIIMSKHGINTKHGKESLLSFKEIWDYNSPELVDEYKYKMEDFKLHNVYEDRDGYLYKCNKFGYILYELGGSYFPFESIQIEDLHKQFRLVNDNNNYRKLSKEQWISMIFEGKGNMLYYLDDKTNGNIVEVKASMGISPLTLADTNEQLTPQRIANGSFYLKEEG